VNLENLDKTAKRDVTRKEYTVDGMTYVVRFMGTVRTGWVKTDKDRWELLLKIGEHHGSVQEAWQDFQTFTHIDVVAGRFGVGPVVFECECGKIVLDEDWDNHICYVRRGEDHEAKMIR